MREISQVVGKEFVEGERRLDTLERDGSVLEDALALELLGGSEELGSLLLDQGVEVGLELLALAEDVLVQLYVEDGPEAELDLGDEVGAVVAEEDGEVEEPGEDVGDAEVVEEGDLVAGGGAAEQEDGGLHEHADDEAERGGDDLAGGEHVHGADLDGTLAQRVLAVVAGVDADDDDAGEGEEEAGETQQAADEQLQQGAQQRQRRATGDGNALADVVVGLVRAGQQILIFVQSLAQLRHLRVTLEPLARVHEVAVQLQLLLGAQRHLLARQHVPRRVHAVQRRPVRRHRRHLIHVHIDRPKQLVHRRALPLTALLEPRHQLPRDHDRLPHVHERARPVPQVRSRRLLAEGVALEVVHAHGDQVEVAVGVLAQEAQRHDRNARLEREEVRLVVRAALGEDRHALLLRKVVPHRLEHLVVVDVREVLSRDRIETPTVSGYIIDGSTSVGFDFSLLITSSVSLTISAMM